MKTSEMTDEEFDDNILAQERDTYESKKAELLEAHEGKYVLIKGDSVIDVFDTEGDAAKHGFNTFGIDEPILVKQILAADPVLRLKGINVPCRIIPATFPRKTV